MSCYPETIQSNLLANSRAGTTITADASAGTEGAWTSVIDPTALESHGGAMFVRNVAVNATDTGMLMDFAYGDTGGGNEVAVLHNVNVGASAPSASAANFGKAYAFPQTIASGKRVSARVEAVITVDTAQVGLFLYQNVHHVEDIGVAVTYGADEDAGDACGTSVAPGTDAFGTPVEIGTTAEDHNVWMVGVDPLGNTGIANLDGLIRIGYGPDSGSVTWIGGHLAYIQKSIEEMAIYPPVAMYAEVSSGTKLWAAAAAANTTAIGVLIHGMSGTEVTGAATGGNANILRGSVVE